MLCLLDSIRCDNSTTLFVLALMFFWKIGHFLESNLCKTISFSGVVNDLKNELDNVF